MTKRELETLIYGDRVELDWSDASGHTTRIQGLYGGQYDKAPEKVVVTITSEIDTLRGMIVITSPENLTRVEHPDIPSGYHHENKDCDNGYEFDRLTLMKMRDNIMDTFDFDKVHRTMVALDWQWVYDNFEKRVPDISEIRKRARVELDRIINAFGTPNQYYCGGTGGFEVRLSIDNETRHPELELMFYVAEWYESYDEDEDYEKDFKHRQISGNIIPI